MSKTLNTVTCSIYLPVVIQQKVPRNKHVQTNDLKIRLMFICLVQVHRTREFGICGTVRGVVLEEDSTEVQPSRLCSCVSLRTSSGLLRR